jgi:hypothetical protein
MEINSVSHPRFEPVTVLLNRESSDAALRNDPEYIKWLDSLAAQAQEGE